VGLVCIASKIRINKIPDYMFGRFAAIISTASLVVNTIETIRDNCCGITLLTSILSTTTVLEVMYHQIGYEFG
jgi:hypothetical protein